MNAQHKLEHLIQSIVAGATAIQLEAECSGLDLNEVGIHGRTPLMVAAAEGLFAAVETLVRNGASVHAIGRSHMTPLHEASANGQSVIANYLLSLGAKVNAETIDGVTPLMSAVAWGNVESAKILLENGADLTRIDCRGASAVDIAREKGEDRAADMIESYARSHRQK
jgi:uncharacterized protein